MCACVLLSWGVIGCLDFFFFSLYCSMMVCLLYWSVLIDVLCIVLELSDIVLLCVFVFVCLFVVHCWG